MFPKWVMQPVRAEGDRHFSYRVRCSFCRKNFRTGYALDDSDECVSLLLTRHKLRAPTCPFALGTTGDNIPLVVPYRRHCLQQTYPSDSVTLPRTPRGAFRILRKNTDSFGDAVQPCDLISTTLADVQVPGNSLAHSVADEDLCEENVELHQNSERSQQLQNVELEPLLKMHGAPHDPAEDFHAPELSQQTVATLGNEDLLTLQLGTHPPAYAEYIPP